MMTSPHPAPSPGMATSCLSATGSASTRASSGMSTSMRPRTSAATVCMCRRSTKLAPGPDFGAEGDILGNRQVGEERKILEDDLYATRHRTAGVKRRRLSLDMIVPEVSASAGQDLDERDLPLPFSPTRQTTSPASMAKLTSLNALIPAYDLEMLSSRRAEWRASANWISRAAPPAGTCRRAIGFNEDLERVVPWRCPW